MEHPSHSSPGPLDSPWSPSRQNKVIMQRQYREKEGECFSTLRDIIKELTGEELQTRQEILRKAINLLFEVLTSRRLRAAEVVPPAPYGTAVFTNHPADTMAAQAHFGYFPQPPSQTWQANPEFGAGSAYYTAYSHGHQYNTMSGMDPAVAQAGYQHYGQHPV